MNWQSMAQACARLGHVVTTAYTTLGADGLYASLDEPDVELVFCGEPQAVMLSKVVDRAEKVKWVIVDGDGKWADKVSHSSGTTVRLLTGAGGFDEDQRDPGEAGRPDYHIQRAQEARRGQYFDGGPDEDQARTGRHLLHHVHLWIGRQAQRRATEPRECCCVRRVASARVLHL